MKISINYKYVNSPWGGGNEFIRNLSNFLIQKKHTVVYNLMPVDIDLILIIDPRMSSELTIYNLDHANLYKKYINPNVKIVHRINECNKRKNLKGIDEFYIKENKKADFSIFVSNWLYREYLNKGYEKNYKVIMSGADSKIFNTQARLKWNSKDKLKIVTHHWGNHWNKGFEYYKILDDHIEQNNLQEKLEFTYIGNFNKSYKPKNIICKPPLAGKRLAMELRKHHMYITGSQNEPSGNHHIEASQLGLPVLYIESGGIPEFCKDFGVGFKKNNFLEKFNYLIDNYDHYYKKIEMFPYNAENMSKEYENLFESLINDNSKIIIKESKLNLNYINFKIYSFFTFLLGRFRFILKVQKTLFLNKYYKYEKTF